MIIQWLHSEPENFFCFRYDKLIQQSIELMLKVSQGTEADGWIHMGVTK